MKKGRTGELPGLKESARRFLRVGRLLRPFLGSYTRLAILGLVSAAAGLLAPQFMRVLVDRVLPGREVSLLGLVVGAMLVTTLFQQIVGTIRAFYGQAVGAHLSADTTVFMMNQVVHLPLRFFQRMPVGDILSRFGDLNNSLQSVRQLFDLVFVQGVFLIAIPPILFWMNWRLALVALATVPLAWGANVLASRALRRVWKDVAEAGAEVRAVNVETLSHIRMLKSMGLERAIFQRTDEATGAARAETLRASRLTVGLGLASGSIRSLGSLVLTYVGWRMILAGSLSLGTFLAFLAYLGRVQGPLGQIASRFSSFQRTAIAMDRLFELLDEPTESDPSLLYDPAYAPAPLAFDGSIRIDELRCRFDRSPFELEIGSLTFPAGSRTGLVGESGSGKSTLLRLLAGLESPTSGSIYYGRILHSSVSPPSIRRSVAMAWHTPDLLRGSLRTNLVVGLKDVSEERLRSVIAACQMERLVTELPEGLETPVAEWGATLSAGQQQRLSLARALLRDAPVLLFDEVTSHLDADTEGALLEGIQPFLEGRTVVFASHRSSTLQFMDRVVSLDAGKVASVAVPGSSPETLVSVGGY